VRKYCSDQISEDEVLITFSKQRRANEHNTILVRKPQEKSYSKDLCVDGRIILEMCIEDTESEYIVWIRVTEDRSSCQMIAE
jgi:hypothetical protein